MVASSRTRSQAIRSGPKSKLVTTFARTRRGGIDRERLGVVDDNYFFRRDRSPWFLCAASCTALESES